MHARTDEKTCRITEGTSRFVLGSKKEKRKRRLDLDHPYTMIYSADNRIDQAMKNCLSQRFLQNERIWGLIKR
jgi:hypothetical protein